MRELEEELEGAEEELPKDNREHASLTDEQLIGVFYECRTLAAQKSKGYGDAWRQQGYMGNLARVLSKSARLRNLAWRDGIADEQAVEAELLDIINIAAMGLTNLRAGNRWGEQHG
jgi:hypothetical protein